MLRVSIIALCCFVSAHGSQVAVNGNGAATLVRRGTKESGDHAQTTKVVQEFSQFKVDSKPHARKKFTCAQLKQGFDNAETKTRETFCELLKNEGMVGHAPCCQKNPDDDCCADSNACQIAEVYNALNMGKCNHGASLAMETPAELTCASIDAQFKQDGHSHSTTTFCADVATFSLQDQATCCSDPSTCCADASSCTEAEVDTALGKPECAANGGRRRRRTSGSGVTGGDGDGDDSP